MTRDFAERCFNQIKGFGEYGFPESHAASFAKLVYISSWIKCHHPAVFACALLNAQPMGFYAPAQIVRDAQENHVEVRKVDINHSQWDNTLEREDGELALRLGFRQVDGFHQEWADRLVAVRTRITTAPKTCGNAPACHTGRSNCSPKPMRSAPPAWIVARPYGQCAVFPMMIPCPCSRPPTATNSAPSPIPSCPPWGWRSMWSPTIRPSACR
jgi:hypothetical protein